LCHIGFAVEETVQVDGLARRRRGVALWCHRSMMPIVILNSGRIVTQRDDRPPAVAERPAAGSAEPIMRPGRRELV
jgi:hypothetical protein